VSRFKSAAIDGTAMLTADKFKMSKQVARHAVTKVIRFATLLFRGLMTGFLIFNAIIESLFVLLFLVYNRDKRIYACIYTMMGDQHPKNDFRYLYIGAIDWIYNFDCGRT
jgi:hypothetical protein